MTLEIQILAWDRHKNVAGLNRLMETQPSPLGICWICSIVHICVLFIDISLKIKVQHISIYRHEAMTDLIAILGTLVDVNGKILIPGINDTVAPVTDNERSSYDPIDFDLVISCSLHFYLFIWGPS